MFARKKSLSSVPLLVYVNAALVLMAGESRGRSDDPPAPADATKQALDKAKNEYSSKIDTIKKEVLQSLDNKIAAARRKKRERAKVPSLTQEVPPALRLDPKILINSQWNFTRRLGVWNQSGAFKIMDGVIYHLDADYPIGAAAVVGPGQIHLSFQGHRKIPEGAALVGKIAPGEFRGALIYQGDEWGFSISRR